MEAQKDHGNSENVNLMKINIWWGRKMTNKYEKLFRKKEKQKKKLKKETLCV